MNCARCLCSRIEILDRVSEGLGIQWICGCWHSVGTRVFFWCMIRSYDRFISDLDLSICAMATGCHAKNNLVSLSLLKWFDKRCPIPATDPTLWRRWCPIVVTRPTNSILGVLRKNKRYDAFDRKVTCCGELVKYATPAAISEQHYHADGSPQPCRPQTPVLDSAPQPRLSHWAELPKRCSVGQSALSEVIGTSDIQVLVEVEA